MTLVQHPDSWLFGDNVGPAPSRKAVQTATRPSTWAVKVRRSSSLVSCTFNDCSLASQDAEVCVTARALSGGGSKSVTRRLQPGLAPAAAAVSRGPRCKHNVWACCLGLVDTGMYISCWQPSHNTTLQSISELASDVDAASRMCTSHRLRAVGPRTCHA